MAADKKHSARFCLQFDPDDAQQQQVIQMLNSLGRGEKSAFIAKAILHYINCSETPKLELLFPPPDDTVYVITQSQLDNLVKTLINRIEPLDDVHLPRSPIQESVSDNDRDSAILNAASIFNF
ncbi:MAG: hypothetical protein ACLSS9_01495 [Acutalibacteraceae bacterium]